MLKIEVAFMIGRNVSSVTKFVHSVTRRIVTALTFIHMVNSVTLDVHSVTCISVDIS